MGKYYSVYTVCGGETGFPYKTIEQAKVVYAENTDEAFSKWVKEQGFKEERFTKLDDNRWHDYYTTYVNEL